MASYDITGTIGKRYRSGDAIETPFAVTIDDEMLNQIVTVRKRDTMEQKRVSVSDIVVYLMNRTK